MAGAQPRNSYRSLFKQLGILPVSFQYILSLMSFIIKNQEFFQTNSSVHKINTRINIVSFYASINILNSLLPSVTMLKYDKAKLTATLRKYLHTHSFYSIDEFLMCKDDL
jgi:hypothetical protein